MACRGSHRLGYDALRRTAVRGAAIGLAVLAGVLFAAGDGQAVKTSFSADFQNFIQMVNDRYCVPRSRTVDSLTSPTARPGDVDAFAIALGHALKVQYGYVSNNPSLAQRYQNLQREVLYDYLQYIQYRRGNASPSALTMRQHAEEAMRGRQSFLTNQPAVQAGAAPSIFTRSEGIQLPQQKQQSQPSGQIDLLNQRPATDPNFARGKQLYNQGVDTWNAGSQAWNAGQQDTAYAYYQKAGELFQQACNLNFASGCVGNYHYKQGQFMKRFQ